jgi:hypothetical protein
MPHGRCDLEMAGSFNLKGKHQFDKEINNDWNGNLQ